MAETVRKNPPRKGPVKAVGYVDMGGGEVRYSTDGWSWFVAGRRRAGRALMRHICGKLKPVVTEEFDKEDADVPYSQDDIATTLQRGDEHFTLAPFTHMVFECAFSSTAPVTAQPPQGLPPPPRPEAPLVEAYAVGYSSASVATAVSTAPATSGSGSSQPASGSVLPVGAAPVLAAPATPALKAPALPPAPAPARPSGAAAWVAFPTAWAPAQVVATSTVAAKIAVSSAAPSAVPSEVKKP